VYLATVDATPEALCVAAGARGGSHCRDL